MSDEQGHDLNALASRPELFEHLEWIWQAFWDLSSDRQIGFGQGPIMWISIDAYARRHRVKDERFDRLLSFLRRMDTDYLAATAAKKPKA
jgi:hypothetical protein